MNLDHKCKCCAYGTGTRVCAVCENCRFKKECEYIYMYGRNSREHLIALEEECCNGQ